MDEDLNRGDSFEGSGEDEYSRVGESDTEHDVQADEAENQGKSQMETPGQNLDTGEVKAEEKEQKNSQTESLNTGEVKAEEKKDEPLDEGEAWFRSIYDPNGTEDEGQAGKRPHKTADARTEDQRASSSGNTEKQEAPHRNYDSYEFKSNENHDTDEGYNYQDPVGGRSPKEKKPRNKNHNRKNNTGVIIGVVAALCVAVVLLGVAAFTTLRGSTSSSSSESVAESKEESEEQVTLGKSTDSSAASDDSSKSTEEANSSKTAATADGELTIPQVVEKVMPSMVQITNTSVEEVQDLFGQTQQQKSVSAGSGIIVGETDDNLLIATNNHVISGSSDIAVTFVDNSAIAGTVQGADADNDLAIVSVKKTDIPEDTQKKISIVTMGDSDSSVVGESVVAIGNALGYGQSVSSGIISALNRTVTDTDGTARTVIQTDASINPGNSGGALLNMKGELIGINEAKLVDESVEGVGYAIPMSVAEPILTNLGSKASREKVDSSKASYLGISVITMPTQYTQNGYPAGVYVAAVTDNGPADQAGIKKGDIITSFDGTSVTTKEALLTQLEYYAAGEKAEISLSRINSDQTGFEKKKVIVTLGNRNDANLSGSTDSGDSSDTQNDGQRTYTDPFANNDGNNGFFNDFFN